MVKTIKCGKFNINKLDYCIGNENQEVEYDHLELDIDISIWVYDIFVSMNWEVNSAILSKGYDTLDISEFAFIISPFNDKNKNESCLSLRSAYIDYVEKTVTIDY